MTASLSTVESDTASLATVASDTAVCVLSRATRPPRPLAGRNVSRCRAARAATPCRSRAGVPLLEEEARERRLVNLNRGTKSPMGPSGPVGKTHDLAGARVGISAQSVKRMARVVRAGVPVVSRFRPAENGVTGALVLQRNRSIERNSFVFNIHNQRGKFTEAALSDAVTNPREVQMAGRKQVKATTGACQGGQSIIGGLDGLIGADVEVKCTGGQTYRGTLRAVGEDFVSLGRASDGRTVLVSRAAVVAVVDELAPGLRAAGRRDAEDGLGGEL